MGNRRSLQQGIQLCMYSFVFNFVTISLQCASHLLFASSIFSFCSNFAKPSPSAKRSKQDKQSFGWTCESEHFFHRVISLFTFLLPTTLLNRFFIFPTTPPSHLNHGNHLFIHATTLSTHTAIEVVGAFGHFGGNDGEFSYPTSVAVTAGFHLCSDSYFTLLHRSTLTQCGSMWSHRIWARHEWFCGGVEK